MINLSEYEELSAYTSLKQASRNGCEKDKEIYMSESAMEVIDFDKVKNEYGRKLRLSIFPASNDALMQSNDKVFFIEFKDGNMGGEIHDVVRKIYESLLLFCDITKQTISDTRSYMTYVLVYNEAASVKYIEKLNRDKTTINESPEFIKFGNILGRLAKDNADVFSLRKRFKGLYFKDVLTVEKKDFLDDMLK